MRKIHHFLKLQALFIIKILIGHLILGNLENLGSMPRVEKEEMEEKVVREVRVKQESLVVMLREVIVEGTEDQVVMEVTEEMELMGLMVVKVAMYR